MIVKNRRRVDFYTHVVATTPEDSSSRRRIWRYGERSFPSMRTASFRGFFTSGRRSRGRRSDLLKLPNLSIDPTFRPRTAGFHWAIVPMYRVGLLVLPWFFHDRVWSNFFSLSKTRPMLCERSLPRSRFFGCHATLGKRCVTSKKRLRVRLV